MTRDAILLLLALVGPTTGVTRGVRAQAPPGEAYPRHLNEVGVRPEVRVRWDREITMRGGPDPIEFQRSVQLAFEHGLASAGWQIERETAVVIECSLDLHLDSQRALRTFYTLTSSISAPSTAENPAGPRETLWTAGSSGTGPADPSLATELGRACAGLAPRSPHRERAIARSGAGRPSRPSCARGSSSAPSKAQ